MIEIYEKIVKKIYSLNPLYKEIDLLIDMNTNRDFLGGIIAVLEKSSLPKNQVKSLIKEAKKKIELIPRDSTYWNMINGINATNEILRKYSKLNFPSQNVLSKILRSYYLF